MWKEQISQVEKPPHLYKYYRNKETKLLSDCLTTKAIVVWFFSEIADFSISVYFKDLGANNGDG